MTIALSNKLYIVLISILYLSYDKMGHKTCRIYLIYFDDTAKGI